jgi:anti-sigma factor ChrR (cupin superfamily)
VIDVEPGSRVTGSDCKLVRFDAGTRFPSHRHLGTETVFVLEGSYCDDDGRCYGAGDRQVMEAGTQHRIRIDGGQDCVAATVLHGLEFTSSAMRLLSRLLRRP